MAQDLQITNRYDNQTLFFAEKANNNTARTGNEEFDKKGYLKIENLWDAEDLYYPVPNIRGCWTHQDASEQIVKTAIHQHDMEPQVPNCYSRYWYPGYKIAHRGIRKKLEKIIGKKLYETYHCDRFYFSGQELEKHLDRPACEISVSVHVSTDLPGKYKDWPIKIKEPMVIGKYDIENYGDENSVILNPGDGVVYKGCECVHWRDPMPTPKRNIFTKKEYYYHQIFFHYVLQDGSRVQHAWDK